MSTLRKMADKGYITISGEALPWVYPTIEALRQQDKTLSEADAEKILKKIGGSSCPVSVSPRQCSSFRSSRQDSRPIARQHVA